MSIDRCTICEHRVDTDVEPEAYAEVAIYTSVAHLLNPTHMDPIDWVCVCSKCREDYVDEAGLFWKRGVPSKQY